MKIKRVTERNEWGRSRVYVWPEGESLIENLMNRRQRPYNVYKKEVLPKLFEQLGLPSTVRARWSRYAGCTCPCSPGFILEGVRNRQFHVTVEA